MICFLMISWLNAMMLSPPRHVILIVTVTEHIVHFQMFGSEIPCFFHPSDSWPLDPKDLATRK